MSIPGWAWTLIIPAAWLVIGVPAALAGGLLLRPASRRHPRRRGMASRHPDRYTTLSDEDRGEWDAIEAGLLDDVGTAIFSDEEGGS